jgi:hypothetical protein
MRRMTSLSALAASSESAHLCWRIILRCMASSSSSGSTSRLRRITPSLHHVPNLSIVSRSAGRYPRWRNRSAQWAVMRHFDSLCMAFSRSGSSIFGCGRLPRSRRKGRAGARFVTGSRPPKLKKELLYPLSLTFALLQYCSAILYVALGLTNATR